MEPRIFSCMNCSIDRNLCRGKCLTTWLKNIEEIDSILQGKEDEIRSKLYSLVKVAGEDRLSATIFTYARWYIASKTRNKNITQVDGRFCGGCRYCNENNIGCNECPIQTCADRESSEVMRIYLNKYFMSNDGLKEFNEDCIREAESFYRGDPL